MKHIIAIFTFILLGMTSAYAENAAQPAILSDLSMNTMEVMTTSEQMLTQGKVVHHWANAVNKCDSLDKCYSITFIGKNSNGHNIYRVVGRKWGRTVRYSY